MSEEIILHHFDSSPFSEKIRVVFGLKGLFWRSVEIPSIMPKPDYTPLTGGYRRTPSLQIGADVYCDTQVILAEIERRRPTPSLIPPGWEGAVWAFNWWADRLFFQTTVPVIFGEIGANVPQAFIEDREKMSGRPFDVKAMAAAGIPLQAQWRSQAAWLDRQLQASASGWIAGPSPSLADAAAYMNVWFLTRTLPDRFSSLARGLEALSDWSRRMAGSGHGRSEPMTGSEALDTAKAASPAAPPSHDPADPLGAAPGEAVVVMADDYGRDPVAGTLVAANAERIVLRREDPRAGVVHVHFPRTGYIALKS